MLKKKLAVQRECIEKGWGLRTEGEQGSKCHTEFGQDAAMYKMCCDVNNFSP